MDEYIEREKLLRDIEHYHLSDGKFQHWVEIQLAADVAMVRHGKWEAMHYEGGILDGTNFDKCSVCGY